MINKCNFDTNSFATTISSAAEAVAMGELVNQDGTPFDDDQIRDYLKEQIELAGENVQLQDSDQDTALNLVKQELDAWIYTPNLKPSDNDIRLYLTAYRRKAESLPNNTDANSDNLGNADFNEEEEIKERFNDDYLATNYGKVSAAKLEAKSLARKVIIASCIKTDDGHIVQDDVQLNREIRIQQQKALDKVITYLRERAEAEPILLERYPEILGPEAYPVMYKDGEYTGIVEEIQRIFGGKLKFNEAELQKIYSSRDLRLLNKTYLEGYHNWVLLNNFEDIFRGTFGKSMAIKEDYSKFTGQDKYSMDAKASNMNTTWRTSDEIWLDKEVNNVVQLLINSIPYLPVGTTTSNGENYLKFNEFCYTICKIKDLVYNPHNPNYVFDYTFLEDNGITDRTIEILRGLNQPSFTELINNIREDPQKTLPAIFELLDNQEVFKVLQEEVFPKENYFLEIDRNLIHSLNVGMFGYSDGINNLAAENSLFSINKRDGLYATNYFGYVTQTVDSIFSSRYLQYFRDNTGTIYVRNMYDQSVNNVERKIADNITVMNSSRLLNYNFLKDQYQITPDYKPSMSGRKITEDYREQVFNISEFTYKNRVGNLRVITDKDGGYKYEFYPSDKDEMIPLSSSAISWDSIKSKIELINGIKFTVPNFQYEGEPHALSILSKVTGEVKFYVDDVEVTFSGEAQFDALRPFLENVLHQNFDNDEKYFNAFAAYYIKEGNIQYGEISKDLMTLASHVMLNQYVSNELVKGLTPSQTRTKLEKIYGEYAPKFDRTLNEIKLITSKDSGTMIQLAQAKALVEGLLTSSQIKDGNGNAVSSSTLSRLLGSFLEQWEIQNKQENSASREFSLLNGVLKDVVTSKEFKDAFMSTSKAHTEMNPQEMEQAGFLYDFIAGLIAPQNGSPIGNGTVSIIPSVNSDKGTIGRLLLDLTKNAGPNEEVSFLDLVLKTTQYNETGKDGKKYVKTVRTFDKEGINYLKNICRTELFKYYAQSKRNIDETWRRVSEIPAIKQILGGTVISYGDFTAINTYCQQNGINTIDFLTEKISEWNAQYPNDPIVLIDQVHYDQDGNTNPQIIKVNNTFKGLLERFSDREATAQFFLGQEISVLKNLIKDNFEVIVPNTRKDDDTEEVRFLRDTLKTGNPDSSWLDAKTDRLVLGKVTVDGKVYNITRLLDLQKLFGNESTTVDGYAELLQQMVESGSITFELNPALVAYNTINYMFGSEWRASTVGAHFAHPSKAQPGADLLVDEASRYNASNKRNVSFTAAMHAFQKNMLNGIPSDYNLSIIDDIKDVLFNVTGTEDKKVKPHDGAIFVNPFIVYLENNSLCGAKAGINKKQFVHFYNEKTGTGGIIKCAGFGLTNDLMKNSPCYRDMMWNMTKRIWRDREGNPYEADITKDYLGRKIDYINKGDKDSNTYYAKEVDGELKYFRIDNIEKINTILEGDTPIEVSNTYKFFETEVDESGVAIAETKTVTKTIRSNYDLWQAFGGYNSLELKEGDNILTTSEASITNVVHAMNFVGIVENANIETQNDVYQPLKHSDIHYLATAGAVKQGTGNINKTDWYGRRHTFNEETGAIEGPSLNFMKIHMNQAGIQLDKEHHADGDELSMMTQVISSCAARGYSQEQATDMYNALRNLAEFGVRDYLTGFQEFFQDPENNADRFQKVITDTIVDALVHQKNDSSDMLSIIAEKLITKAREGKEIKFADIKGIIPYSDSSVFKKLISTINVTLTKASIKTKMPGILSVLCPSYGIMQLYGDRKLESYKTEKEILDRQEKEYDKINLIENLSKIDLGRYYLITYKDGTHRYECINTPNKYYAIKENAENIESIVEAIYNKDTNKPLGRELASYNIRFIGTYTDSTGNLVTKHYQLYDLDSVRELFEERAKPKNEQNPTIIKNLTRKVQLEIEALSTQNNSGKTVTIDNEIITVSPNSIETQPYEVVMPKIFATQFGLDTYDSVDQIKRNPDFFYGKIRKNFLSLIPDRHNDFYDLELKKINGKHIYLVSRDHLPLNNPRLTKKSIKTYSNPKDHKVYRIGNDNKPMYPLSVTQQTLDKPENVIPQDEVWEYRLDNGKSIEIIVTNNFNHYLDTLSYNCPKISNRFKDTNDVDGFQRVYDILRRSNNKNCKQFLKYLNHQKQDIIDDREEYSPSINSAIMQANEDMGSSIDNNEYLNSLVSKISNELYASFIKSLNIVAARIPAQSMQSFMPMKVVGFDNPDVNTAYVSTAQIWLQGSDYDIDAVSLAAYAFDKNGKYIMWSPYANIGSVSLLNASESLPFPTGKELELSKTERFDYNEIISFPGDKDKIFKVSVEDGEIKVNLRNFNPEQIRQFAKLVKTFNETGLPAPISPIMIGNIDVSYKVIQEIKKIVDKHNMYISNIKNNDTLENMIKNFMMHEMYDIINDPINLIEAQAPIDLQTGLPKKIANSSPRAMDSIKANPGDFTTNIHGIVENQTGKKGVGICAVGLKSFFALTQHYNATLRNGNPRELQRLILGRNGITLLGKTYYSLANNLKHGDNPFEHEVPEKISNFYLNREIREYYKKLGVRRPKEVPEQVTEVCLEEGIRKGTIPTHMDRTILEQYVKDGGRLDDGTILAFLQSVDNDQDAALALSALLSLATDNAKELALAKLNAGTNMLGMYIYGLTIGMSFQDISKILMSDIGFQISDMMTGNAFTEDFGMNIQNVFDYFEIGPTKALLKYDQREVKSNGRLGESPLKLFGSLLKQELKSDRKIKTAKDIARLLQILSTDTSKSLEDKLQIIENLREKKDPAFQRLLDFAIDYIEQQNIRMNSNVEGFNAYNELQKLSEGAEEMKTLGQLLHLNQGLYTSVSDSIALIERIEGVTETRKYAILKKLQRAYPDGYPRNPDKVTDFLKARKEGKPFTGKLEGFYDYGTGKPKNKTYVLNGESYTLGSDDRFNLHFFLTDPDYREKQINLYDKYKSTFNLLDVISKVPHFNSYCSIADMAHQSAMKTSAKYRAVYNLSGDVINKIGAHSSVDIQNILKKMESFVNEYLRKDFLLKYPYTIRIPEGQYYYKKGDVPEIVAEGLQYIDAWGDSTLVTSQEGLLMQLGTRWGDASFKRLMEHKIIPDLKAGITGSGTEEFLKNNIFIQGLQPSVFSQTPNYTAMLGFSLPINMSPRTDAENAAFDRYKQAFNDLRDSGIQYKIGPNYYDLTELFFIYNQIAYQGRPGENTLTKIFEDSRNYGLIQDYQTFENYFDMNQDIIMGSDITLEELVAWCAPKANPRSTNLNYFYYADMSSGKMSFWKPEEKDFESEIDDLEEFGSTAINGHVPRTLTITKGINIDVFPVEEFEGRDVVGKVRENMMDKESPKHDLRVVHEHGIIKRIILDGEEEIIPPQLVSEFSEIPTTKYFDIGGDNQFHIGYSLDKLYQKLNTYIKCHK